MICLHNTPATYVKIPTYAAPTKDIDGTFYNFVFFLLNIYSTQSAKKPADDEYKNSHTNAVFV